MLDFDPGFFVQFTLAQRYFCSVCFLKTFLSLPPPGSGLNDGQWHAIRLVAKENFAMLTIDGEEASAVRSTSPLTITTGGTYHLGGKGHPNTIATDLTKTSHPSLQPTFIVIPSYSSSVPIQEAREASEYKMFTTLTAPTCSEHPGCVSVDPDYLCLKFYGLLSCSVCGCFVVFNKYYFLCLIAQSPIACLIIMSPGHRNLFKHTFINLLLLWSILFWLVCA